jgi:hypothetical protein
LKNSVYLFGIVALSLSGCAHGVAEVALVEGDVADGGLREAGGSGSRGEPPPHDSGIVDTGLPDQDASRDAGGPDAELVADASDSGHAHDAGLPDANLPDSGTPTCASHGYAGVLITFDLSRQPGGEPSVPPMSTAAGVTSSALARAPALTATGGSGSINSSGWATSASADPAKYYSFTVSPASGCAFTVASLSLDVSASATGPGAGDVATSADGFTQRAGTFAGTSSGQLTVVAGPSAGALEIRVYGYAASGSSGTLRIQNTMSLSGSID